MTDPNLMYPGKDPDFVFPEEGMTEDYGFSLLDMQTMESLVIDRCIKAAESDPEPEGEMPPEFYLVPLEDALRAAIKATKKSIIARLQALKDQTS